jgi:hypothetical protein
LPLPEVDQCDSRIGRPIHSPECEDWGWEKAEDFKRELESDYGAKQNGGREVLDIAPENASVKGGYRDS